MLNFLLRNRALVKNAVKNNLQLFPTISPKCIAHRNLSTIGQLNQPKRLWNPNANSVRSEHRNSVASQILTEHRKKLDVDTNVGNNVLLYKNEEDDKLHFTRFIAIGTMMIWSLIAYGSYLLVGDIIQISWSEYTKKEYLAVFIFGCTCAFGPLGFFAIMIGRTRVVTHIILHKGGKTVSIATPGYFYGTRLITVPVNHVYARYHVHGAKQILIKIKDIFSHFTVPTSGKFINRDLYDCVIQTRNL